MGNVSGAGGASHPNTLGYVPAEGEVSATPRPATTNEAESAQAPAAARTDDRFQSGSAPGGARTQQRTPALAEPAPRRLQDIARNAGDTTAVGSDTGGSSGLGQWLLDLLLEIITLGQHDTRTFNTYTTEDKQGFADQGRTLAQRAFATGNGAQLTQFVVRNGAGAPQMQGDPPQVRVQPRLRAAVEAELRQAFANPDGSLRISEQALRIRADAMVRGMREELTRHVATGSHPRPHEAAGAATPARPQAVDLPRTTDIQLQARTDRLPLASATSRRDVDRALAQRGPSLDRLERYHTYSWPDLSIARPVPSRAQAESVRNTYAQANLALSRGDFAEAQRLYAELGLPLPIGSDGHIDTSRFTEKQWHTALALGGAELTSHGSLNTHLPNTFFNAIDGNARYSVLLNDMAERGVSPLAAPPTQLMLQAYYANIATETAHLPVAERRQALLDANQRVMEGLQVHYRGAGGRDIHYGRNDHPFHYLRDSSGELVAGDNGQPLRFDTLQAARTYGKEHLEGHWQTYTIADRDRHGGRTLAPQAPDSWDDVTRQRVYGQRWESDCEGMASFRLRTLPQGFRPLGVVMGGPRSGGIGHAVAIFCGPDGTPYISSNGKTPIAVTDNNHDGRIDAEDVHRAVTAEFAAVYHRGDGQAGSGVDNDFIWGISAARHPPAGETDPVNWQANQMMRDAVEDQALRTGLEDDMGAPNWSSLAP